MYISPATMGLIATVSRRKEIRRSGSSNGGTINAADQRRRRLVREAARAHRGCPVKFVTGTVEPHIEGESYFFTTPSGKTRVRHPGAYGWKTLYWPSTLEVVVGIDWPGLTLADQGA